MKEKRSRDCAEGKDDFGGSRSVSADAACLMCRCVGKDEIARIPLLETV